MRLTASKSIVNLRHPLRMYLIIIHHGTVLCFSVLFIGAVTAVQYNYAYSSASFLQKASENVELCALAGTALYNTLNLRGDDLYTHYIQHFSEHKELEFGHISITSGLLNMLKGMSNVLFPNLCKSKFNL